MRVAVYRGEGGGHRGRMLAEAMFHGFRKHGLRVDLYKDFSAGVVAPLAVAYGWRNQETFAAYKKAGGHYVYMDLGYWHRKPSGARRWDGYHKVSVDAWCPSVKMRRGCPNDRFKQLGIPIGDGTNGDSIIVAGMSAKSAAHHGFAPEQWERATIEALAKRTQRKIVYRPKPSWDFARPIGGASFQRLGTEIDGVLPTAFAVVTHHSNAAVDAMAAGVPFYCEAGVARPLSMPNLKCLDDPPQRSRAEREALLADIAYTQWTPTEMRAGACWDYIKGIL